MSVRNNFLFIILGRVHVTFAKRTRNIFNLVHWTTHLQRLPYCLEGSPLSRLRPSFVSWRHCCSIGSCKVATGMLPVLKGDLMIPVCSNPIKMRCRSVQLHVSMVWCTRSSSWRNTTRDGEASLLSYPTTIRPGRQKMISLKVDQSNRGCCKETTSLCNQSNKCGSRAAAAGRGGLWSILAGTLIGSASFQGTSITRKRASVRAPASALKESKSSIKPFINSSSNYKA